MIRFRNIEDDRRYTVLRAELFASLAAAGITGEALAMAMRNLGKIEAMIHLDALRQGLAMGAIASSAAEHGTIADPRSLKAWQLHATIYGSGDSPLRDVEREWMRRLSMDENWLAASWLDDKPMRFAPMTLTEWLGQEQAPPPVYKVDAPHAPIPAAKADGSQSPMPPPSPWTGKVSPGACMKCGEPRDLEGSTDKLCGLCVDDDLADAPADDPGAPESPEFCDRIRDAIQELQQGGWKPESWTMLIRTLSLHMRTDAGYLDIQLSTHVGRTVLDQCGLYGLAPGSAISLLDLFPDGEAPLASVLPTAAEPPESPEED